MTLLWIGGVFFFCFVLYLLYEFAVEPSRIKDEAAEDAKDDSPGETERTVFEHEKEIAEATKQDIEDGYSQQ